MSIKENNVTAQELITPVPAVLDGVQTGHQSSLSCDRNAALVRLAKAADNATSSSQHSTERTNIDVLKERKCLDELRNAEEETFNLLGEKLVAAFNVAYKATNIHKPIRENLNCAFALYQELKEQRRQLALRAKSTEVVKQWKEAETQTDYLNTSDISRRNMDLAESPTQERKRKRAKNTSTMAALQVQSEVIVPTQEIGNSPTSEWKNVKKRKKKIKKMKQNNKRNLIREQGEALAIKTGTSESYADVIKEMKKKINPLDIGVEIKCIRRTRAGELLINLKKGEGQAEKLRSAISDTLGNEVMVRTITNNLVIDIRYMDEATDKTELLNALIEATKSEDPTLFKILNIRESYGRTRQALVLLPAK